MVEDHRGSISKVRETKAGAGEIVRPGAPLRANVGRARHILVLLLAALFAVSYSILIGPFALAQEAGTVALSPAQPVVGAALTATLADPDGAISDATWQWASSSDWDASTGTGTWSDISGATSASYTPARVLLR